MLSRLCLELTCSCKIRHVCKVNAERILAELPFELTYSLEERQRFNVAHSSTDFSDYEIIVALSAENLHVALDLICDVRYNLYGLSEIVTTALLFNHALVDTSGRDVVGLGCLYTCKSFIMAKVKVCLLTVNGYITFSVLIRIERSRVNVDVWIKLLDSDVVTPCLQEFTD